MSKIKVGQIYKQKNNEIFIVTLIQDGDVFLIYDDGYNASYPIEAVNSKEFRGGEESL